MREPLSGTQVLLITLAGLVIFVMFKSAGFEFGPGEMPAYNEAAIAADSTGGDMYTIDGLDIRPWPFTDQERAVAASAANGSGDLAPMCVSEYTGQYYYRGDWYWREEKPKNQLVVCAVDPSDPIRIWYWVLVPEEHPLWQELVDTGQFTP